MKIKGMKIKGMKIKGQVLEKDALQTYDTTCIVNCRLCELEKNHFQIKNRTNS
ncbi:hypothetical protein LNTAR_18460 [Lentisphaera araneosa HTCC2155]|uniref:Uncharacterized protein n=1 Tax=Lentisphaera araneosa HTCC2155 TaxID=313628 RepID=A6DNJ8_9BACT|nr:hypothetical protein LNTAR_18460 [Lentisphaera araneosa HTCC2155]